MARTKSVLGDVRRDERAELMLERIVASGSLKRIAVGRGIKLRTKSRGYPLN
jgi:hypothetical protein